MYLIRVKVKRDALTEINVEVPEYELPVLRLLHGEDMVHEVGKRYWPPAVDAAGNPVPFDLPKAWDILMMKYASAAKEDRGAMTGHPALQAYADPRNFFRLVRPTLNLGKPKVKAAPKPKPKPKRSHHRKPAPAEPAEPATLQA